MKPLWEKIVALAGSNFGLKVLALIIAVGLRLAGQRDIERSIEVPLEVRNLPAGLMLMDNRVDFVVLRLSGPRRQNRSSRRAVRKAVDRWRWLGLSRIRTLDGALF